MEKQFFNFDMLVAGLCLISAVLLLFLWRSWGRKPNAPDHLVEAEKPPLGNFILCTLIVLVSVILLLLLKAIVNFSPEAGYFLFLILAFLVCGLGISYTFRMIFNLQWDRPRLDICKLVLGFGLLWLFALGVRYLVLGLIFLVILMIHGPWIKLAK